MSERTPLDDHLILFKEIVVDFEILEVKYDDEELGIDVAMFVIAIIYNFWRLYFL